MKHGSERHPGVMDGSTGTCRGSRLHVLTLTEVIRSVKRTAPSVSSAPSTSRPGRAVWCFSALLHRSPLAPASPLLTDAHRRPAAHECVCVIASDPRASSASVKERGRARSQIRLLQCALLSAPSSHPHWFNTRITRLSPPWQSANYMYCICSVHHNTFCKPAWF